MKKIIFNLDVVHIININNSDLVGIVWADGTKAIIVETKAGFVSLNRGLRFNLASAITSTTKQEYLNNVRYLIEGQPLLFSTEREIIEWFSK